MFLLKNKKITCDKNGPANFSNVVIGEGELDPLPPPVIICVIIGRKLVSMSAYCLVLSDLSKMPEIPPTIFYN